MTWTPTAEQSTVVAIKDGVTAVSACPGSGKTQTLVERCKALPERERRLITVFNKLAAGELQNRIGHDDAFTQVSTFHSICFREIMQSPKKYGLQAKPSLSQLGAFGLMCESNDCNERAWDKSPFDEDFVNMAEHGLTDADLEDMKSTGNFHESKQAGYVLEMRAHLIRHNLVTFDSMVRLVAAKAKTTLSGYAHHIMVDEYQDVDRFQFDIICGMSMDPMVKSFMVVGDPNQRIYEWRGALDDAYESLVVQRPGTRVLPMTVNFRSYDEILKNAEYISPVGMTGVRGPATDSVRRYPAAAGDLVHLVPDRDKTNLAKQAILCRYKRDTLTWQLRLAKQNIPVMLIGGSKDFWGMSHVKLAMMIRGRGGNIVEFEAHPNWLKMQTRIRYASPEGREEAVKDASWILQLSDAEIRVVQDCIQSENGLKVSTIHKTKGLEFDGVMVFSKDEKERARLQDDRCVYYVAATRARDRLLLS